MKKHYITRYSKWWKRQVQSSNKALVTPGSIFLRKYFYWNLVFRCVSEGNKKKNYFECDSREINDCVLSLLSCLWYEINVQNIICMYVAVGPAYYDLHPQKELTICIFFNLPGVQKPRRNYLSNKTYWAI